MMPLKWTPQQPIESNVPLRIPAQDYGTDAKMSEDGDLSFLSGDMDTVSGVDNFKQKFRTMIFPEKDDRFPWGVATNIFQPLTKDQFDESAEKLAHDLVSHATFDSLTNEPIGLGHTIEKIFNISREKFGEKNVLTIDLKATGMEELLEIQIPFPN